MDINQLRAGVTVVSLALFIGIMAWTWARRRRSGFEEAAQLPFVDDIEQDGDNAGAAR